MSTCGLSATASYTALTWSNGPPGNPHRRVELRRALADFRSACAPEPLSGHEQRRMSTCGLSATASYTALTWSNGPPGNPHLAANGGGRAKAPLKLRPFLTPF